MTVTLYGIPNCDTVKKARAWLAQHGIEHRFHDLRRDGLPREALDAWLQEFGWEHVVNRRGSTWRALDAASQARVRDAASAREFLLAHPAAVKRPVVEWPRGRRTIGFDPGRWVLLAAQ